MVNAQQIRETRPEEAEKVLPAKRTAAILIKPMETDDEKRGKAYVHWKSWHEAFPGMVSRRFLDGLTLEKCTDWAFRFSEGIWVAKDGDRVVGFICVGDRGEEAPGVGEVFALYVLSEYYGTGVAQELMQVGLRQLAGYSAQCLWVLKENRRAIRFYEKCGFRFDGAEEVSPRTGAVDCRMVRETRGWKIRAAHPHDAQKRVLSSESAG